MLSRFRTRSLAALVATVFLVAACGEGETLPTTIDPVEMQADIAAFEAGFEAPATDAFAGIGYAIDNAILAAGGVASRSALLRMPAAMVIEGPAAPAVRFRDHLLEVSTDDIANAIPLSALGKTFVYNLTTDEYEVSSTLTGAPANGVRFRLYALEPGVEIVASPLVQVGWVDITRTGTTNSLTGRIQIYAMGGTKVMDYSATVTNASTAPAFSVTGFAGTGVNRVDFLLTTGISLTTGSVTITWQTDVVARNARSRVQLAIGGGQNPPTTIGATLRAGVRKVDINGTIGFFSGGTLAVKIGNKLVATIVITDVDVTVAGRDGAPLSAEEEETLFRIFEWFETSFEVPDILLGPLFTILDVDGL
jgi:hypothetical protein